MNRYAVMSVTLLAVLGTRTANAQQVVEDPGYCAQYYPSANCTNYGPGNPLYPGSYVPSGPAGGYRGPYAEADPAVMVRHQHRRRHRH